MRLRSLFSRPCVALAAIACLACVARAGAPPSHTTAARDTSRAPGDSSVLVLAGPKEPGTRLIVTGRVLDHARTKPSPRVRVLVYHTDATGRYGASNTPRGARLSGALVTDRNGRFEVRTIRPAPYPGGTIPAHIHFVVSGRAEELQFEDDPLVKHGRTPRDADEPIFVRPVTTDSLGVQRVTVDLWSPT
jgi:protocatechuate 3,4-dioxygenase beta subunit